MQEGNLDVLGIWFGTEADQPEDLPTRRKTRLEAMSAILAHAHRGCESNQAEPLHVHGITSLPTCGKARSGIRRESNLTSSSRVAG